ncbi:MAG: glycosyltransferase family 92 protein [Caulobacteraceae bacterium]
MIVAIAKNEGEYLLEWIAHHQAIGVDHFIIFDNDSSDGTAKILEVLSKSGHVTAVPWPTRDEYPSFHGVSIGPQIPAYREGLKMATASGRWKWIGCLDVDEFIVLDRKDSIEDFLDGYPDAAAIGFNWRMFGSSGFKERPAGMVTTSFFGRAPDDWDVNRHVKSFARLECVQELGIHLPRLKDGRQAVDTLGQVIDPAHNGLHSRIAYNGAWINHYYTKSEADFQKKRQRGRVSKHPLDAERIRRSDEFKLSDRNDVLDYSITRFCDGMMRRLRKLEKLTVNNHRRALVCYKFRTAVRLLVGSVLPKAI